MSAHGRVKIDADENTHVRTYSLHTHLLLTFNFLPIYIFSFSCQTGKFQKVKEKKIFVSLFCFFLMGEGFFLLILFEPWQMKTSKIQKIRYLHLCVHYPSVSTLWIFYLQLFYMKLIIQILISLSSESHVMIDIFKTCFRFKIEGRISREVIRACISTNYLRLIAYWPKCPQKNCSWIIINPKYINGSTCDIV